MGAVRRWLGSCVAAAVLLLGMVFGTLLALPVPSGAAGTPGTLTCISTIFGVTYTVEATMGGVLQIGGFEPDTLTGNCTISGDNTGTIDVESGLGSLIASDGSQNDGTIEFVGDDVTFAGPGTFTNNGSVIDEAPGYTQSVTISDFVNLGTVQAELPSGSTRWADPRVGRWISDILRRSGDGDGRVRQCCRRVGWDVRSRSDRGRHCRTGIVRGGGRRFHGDQRRHRVGWRRRGDRISRNVCQLVHLCLRNTRHVFRVDRRFVSGGGERDRAHELGTRGRRESRVRLGKRE